MITVIFFYTVCLITSYLLLKRILTEYMLYIWTNGLRCFAIMLSICFCPFIVLCSLLFFTSIYTEGQWTRFQKAFIKWIKTEVKW